MSDERETRRLLVKNSIANLVGGASAALLACVVPPVLSRYLALEVFSFWALILQIASYTAILSFGIQGAVGRYVAFALACGDHDHASGIASAGRAILSVAASAAIVVMAVFAWQLPTLFRSVPEHLLEQGRWSLMIVGVTLAAGLPFTAYNGVFTGLQRNEIPAAITGISRLVLAAALIVTCMVTRSLVPMAIAFAAANLVSYFCQWLAYRRFAHGVPVSSAGITGRALRELASYSSSYLVWTVAMFMVNGLDVALVGHFDFKSVAIYASCVGLITFISGLQQALFSPLVQLAAQYDARGDREAIGRLLLTSTQLSAIVLAASGGFVLMFAPELLRLWLGPSFAADGAGILSLLVIGNSIRLVAVPFSLLMLATDQHKRTRVGPILEGASNLATAVVCGQLYGAKGVAAGMIIGAVVGQLFNYFVNLPNCASRISIARVRLLAHGVLIPMAAFAPCYAAAAYRYATGESIHLAGSLAVLLGGAAVLLFRRRASGILSYQ